jgi:hypothetical protein
VSMIVMLLIILYIGARLGYINGKNMVKKKKIQ